MTAPDPATAGRRQRRWFLGGAAAIGLVVAWTCAPIFANPQLRPDDYRYLDQLQRPADDPDAPPTTVVENRWDHLWWIDVPGAVRFFRPTVVASYGLDSQLWGAGDVAGRLWTNVALHAACALMVLLLLLRIVASKAAAVLASTLFAAFFCHGEAIWYVAGRTDTLAALGFLGALVWHVRFGADPRLRWGSLPIFAFALLSKELALVLPVVCWLFDRALAPDYPGWRGYLRQRRALLAGWGLTAAAVAALRFSVLGGLGSDAPYPYFFAPSHPEFLGHVGTALRSYAENLFAAQQTPPFLDPARLERFSSAAGLVAAVVGLAGVAAVSRDRRSPPLLGLAAATLLPVLLVYVSERYLYLPSVALAGLVAVGLARAEARPWTRALTVALVLAWTGHQAWWLRAKQEASTQRQPNQSAIVAGQLAPVAGEIPRGARLLLLNAPFNWLGAQFAEAQMRVMLGDPTLRATVLTVMPLEAALGGALDVTRVGPSSLRVVGRSEPGRPALRHAVMARGGDRFPWVPMGTGTTLSGPRLPFQVRVLAGIDEAAAGLRFDFDRPLEAFTLLRWLPGPPAAGDAIARIRAARVQVGW